MGIGGYHKFLLYCLAGEIMVVFNNNGVVAFGNYLVVPKGFHNRVGL
jgi:hypothetical protein